MEFLTNPETWIALITLTALEIVLGIDNIVFISIMAGKLPPEQRDLARRLGLGAALIMRIALLFSISFIVGLTAPLFNILGRDVSGRDLILLGGGLFLIAKATFEIHERLEGEESHAAVGAKAATLTGVVLQIMLLDIVFSLDSVITAIGLAKELWIMVTAVVLAVVVMLFAAKPIGELVDRHPSLKILALSFLLLDRHDAWSPRHSTSRSRASTSTSRWASASLSRRSTSAPARGARSTPSRSICATRTQRNARPTLPQVRPSRTVEAPTPRSGWSKIAESYSDGAMIGWSRVIVTDLSRAISMHAVSAGRSPSRPSKTVTCRTPSSNVVSTRSSP